MHDRSNRHFHYYARAALRLGATVWTDQALVKSQGGVTPPGCDWIDDADVLMKSARLIRETRVSLNPEDVRPVLVFVSEAGPLSRYPDLADGSDTYAVKLAPVSRDGYVRGAGPSRFERDGQMKEQK